MVDVFFERCQMLNHDRDDFFSAVSVNIMRSCDTLIQLNDNKTTNAFEHSCVLPQWCTGDTPLGISLTQEC